MNNVKAEEDIILCTIPSMWCHVQEMLLFGTVSIALGTASYQ
ncbi:MAG: hypothetical protein ACLRSD_05805 [Oscillibacter sp.]